MFNWGGMTLGMREGLIVLIALVALYMLVVLLRIGALRRREPLPDLSELEQAAGRADRKGPAADNEEDSARAEPATAEPSAERAPPGMAEDVLYRGLIQEIAQLREEVDILRGELAALRDDMRQEMTQMRAAQTVSPLYGDAMQLALAGYDPAAIAERCGIARAEAELVVALTKSREG